MPKVADAALAQPVRYAWEEMLFPIMPTVLLLLCWRFSIWYLPLHFITSFLVYWIARIIYVQWKWGRFFREVPSMPASRLIGHLGMIPPEELIQRLKEFYDKCGGVMGVWLPIGYSPRLSLNDADAFRVIMSQNNTPKGLIMQFFEYGTDLFDAVGSGWLGTGLLTSNGDLWKSRRDLITPAFHFQILQNYMQIFQSRSETLANRMLKYSGQGKESFDIFPLCTDCTLDIIGACAFGLDLGCQTEEEPSHYVKAIREITEVVFQRTFNALHQNRILYALSSAGRRWSRLVRTVHALPDRLIRERRAYVRDHQEEIEHKKKLDFLDLLLTVQDENGQGLSELAIRNEVDTFLFEGHDTTAAGLAWTLYCLAAYPEYQDRARAEVDRVLKDHDAPTYEEAKSQLEELDLIVKESLRLYPPVPFIARNSTVDLELNGYHIPAGTELMLQIYGVQRNAKYWKDPETFRPERFREDGIKHPFAYLPFSAGHRSCIGQIFAMLEEKTILAMLLKRFEFTLDTSTPIDVQTHVILRPKHGIKLFIKPRK
jgi:cytochrome P450